MCNVKKRAFSVFETIRTEKPSFQRLSRHFKLNRPTRSGLASCRMASESGRSMVEMLGVLAIIGVLSIGGIAGYTTAISYYRANKIINDVNLRATMIATNIATNGNTTYKSDMTPQNALNQPVTVQFTENTFEISVAGVQKTDCNHILNQTLPNADVYIGRNFATADSCTDNTTMTFGFSNDLAPRTRHFFHPDNYIACTGNTPSCPCRYYRCQLVNEVECTQSTAEIDCESGVCLRGLCVLADTCSESVPCVDGMCFGGKCVSSGCIENPSMCTGNTPYCSNSGICVECTENTHCNDGEATGDFFCGHNWKDLPSAPEQSNHSICTKIIIAETRTIDGKEYTVSNGPLNWWDAQNFCAALGKQMISATTLNTSVKEDGSYKNSEGRTDFADKIQEVFDFSGYIWTNTAYGESPSNPSLKTKNVISFNMDDSAGGLYNTERNNYNHARPLCVD